MKRPRSHATRSPLSFFGRKRGAGRAEPRLEPGRSVLRRLGKHAVALSLAALMLGLIGLLMVNFVGQVLQSARLEERRVALEAEVAALNAGNLREAGRADYYESDVYAELVARGQLGWARDNDVVVLTTIEPTGVPLSAESGLSGAEPEPTLPPLPVENWRLWWRAFFPPEA